MHAIVLLSVCKIQTHSLPKVYGEGAHLYALGPLTYQSTDHIAVFWKTVSLLDPFNLTVPSQKQCLVHGFTGIFRYS